jgi:hypothetical protein
VCYNANVEIVLMRRAIRDYGRETISGGALLAGYTRAARARIAESTGYPFPLDLPLHVGDDVEFGSRGTAELRRGAFHGFLANNRCQVVLHPDPGQRALLEMYVWQFTRLRPEGDERTVLQIGDDVGVSVSRGVDSGRTYDDKGRVRKLLVRETTYRTGEVVGFSWIQDERGRACQRAYVLEHPTASPSRGRPTAAESRVLGPRDNARRDKRAWTPHEADIRRVYRDGVEVARLPWVSEEQRVPHPDELARDQAARAREKIGPCPPAPTPPAPVNIRDFAFRRGDAVTYDTRRGAGIGEGSVVYVVGREVNIQKTTGGTVVPDFEQFRAAWRDGVLVAARPDVYQPDTELPVPYDTLEEEDEIEYISQTGRMLRSVATMVGNDKCNVTEDGALRRISVALVSRVWRDGLLVAVEPSLLEEE